MGFFSFVTNLDSFGTSVQVNFGGKSKFKTAIGALFTFVTKSFMLFYTIQRAVRVMDYVEPNLSSYEIKDDRIDMEPLNLDEYEFDLVFGFIDRITWKPVELDPQIAKFFLSNTSYSIDPIKGR